MSTLDVAAVDEKVCNEAKGFLDLFYEVIDRKRERLLHLYSDNATLVWNGNTHDGGDSIFRFISGLPETEHTVQSMDAHRLPPAVSDLQEALVALVAGTVSVGGVEHGFTQSLTLVAEDGKLRIRSDRFRYID